MTIASNIISLTKVDRSTDTVFVGEVTVVTEFSASTTVTTEGISGITWEREHGTEAYPSADGEVTLAVIEKRLRDGTRTVGTREKFCLSPEHARALAKQLLIVADLADADR